MPRTAFFVSGRTGITAEMLGHSLISQFEEVNFRRITLPYIDSIDKAREAIEQIREQARTDGVRPVIFSTLIDEELRQCFYIEEALTVDIFATFIKPLEEELGVMSSHTAGKVHGIANFEEYKNRIDAVNYSMSHDDGGVSRNLADADVILVGVSRAGKTPTCLYLALQYGIKAANYPLTPEDFSDHKLPRVLANHRNKLFGLTIQPERLSQIRAERKPGSHYASIDICRAEVSEAETLMKQAQIPYLNTTSLSIEELASSILHHSGLKRRVF
ncbi:posphoenolpyruvate synthetase regulatory kinase/phosphorylase PpsR [Jeongeupia chitinilytica]|uniref:Putative phosphoenolpyruvate synthase regulatory protein n=1 Tax=Jeongeupia chitinilytica TaxID=1041641 RepID=A0ABQ3GZT8_9NEIS|nr:pyruvate, water dikinase regulatory protein [Jeongeupia chitinilytica]GHD59356.1 putative phosphoenolpyruvate synthase regulatory protein [Jeongeupia chitinilytica]